MLANLYPIFSTFFLGSNIIKERANKNNGLHQEGEKTGNNSNSKKNEGKRELQKGRQYTQTSVNKSPEAIPSPDLQNPFL